MESSNALRPLDESALRELPQLSLRIAPLREPVSSRTLSVPSPLEPNASGARETNSIPTNGNSGEAANAKAGLPTVTEFLNAARTKTTETPADSPSSVERPPRPILPAFVNLRALEKIPFSTSFDDGAAQATRKRRRLEHQADSFSEHLQLPIPQAQKEQRPPPFGPFAILNGLNEPPPNAAFLPPIEVGSNISQLLTKPSGGDADIDAGVPTPGQGTSIDVQLAEKRGARIEEMLRTSLSVDENDARNYNDERLQNTNTAEPNKIALLPREADPSQPHSPLPTAPKEDAPISPKTRGRSRKNLRRWTDEETTTLLRGVVKCGIGNWTAILAQPELEFNQRTASNLKDRYGTYSSKSIFGLMLISPHQVPSSMSMGVPVSNQTNFSHSIYHGLLTCMTVHPTPTKLHDSYTTPSLTPYSTPNQEAPMNCPPRCKCPGSTAPNQELPTLQLRREAHQSSPAPLQPQVHSLLHPTPNTAMSCHPHQATVHLPYQLNPAQH